MSGARPRVALVACPSYERETVQAALDRCLELLGGLEALVPRGARVLVKPNLLLAVGPDRAVCTHPEVVRAALVALGRRQAERVVGDSPMFAKTSSALRKTGIAAVMEELEVAEADMERLAVVHAPEGRRFKRFEIVAIATEVDLVVNLCKLKTHHTTGLTLAVKNLLGLVPGVDKSKWHLKAPSRAEMTSMLVDLYEALAAGPPMIHLCDGVVAMEGEGPGTAGTPREVRVLAASTDATALDSVLGRLVGFGPAGVSTVAEAERRGIARAGVDDVDLVGDPLAELAVEGFRPCRGTLASGAASEDGFPFNLRFVRERMVERPVVRQELCTGCGECVKVCAAGAVAVAGESKKARIDLDRCIRCYCCVEACRYAAARLGPRPLLARAADRRHLWPWLAAGLLLAASGAAALLALSS